MWWADILTETSYTNNTDAASSRKSGEKNKLSFERVEKALALIYYTFRHELQISRPIRPNNFKAKRTNDDAVSSSDNYVTAINWLMWK